MQTLLKSMAALPYKSICRIGLILKDFVKRPDHFIVTSLFTLICVVVYLLPIPLEYSAFNLTYLIEHPSTLSAWVSLPMSWVSHAGLRHLMGNMFFFLLVAPRVEKRLGARHFIWLLIISGFSASILYSLSGHWDTYSLGASGIVYAVIGAFLVFSKRRLLTLFLLPFILFNIMEQIVASSFPGVVANMAHVYGFMMGIIVALWFLAFPCDHKKK